MMEKLSVWLFGPRHVHTWVVTPTMGAGWSEIYKCSLCGKVEIG